MTANIELVAELTDMNVRQIAAKVHELGLSELSPSTLVKNHKKVELVRMILDSQLPTSAPETVQTPTGNTHNPLIRNPYKSSESTMHEQLNKAITGDTIVFCPIGIDAKGFPVRRNIVIRVTIDKNGLMPTMPVLQQLKFEWNTDIGNVSLVPGGAYWTGGIIRNLSELHAMLVAQNKKTGKSYLGFDDFTVSAIIAEARKHIPNLENTPVTEKQAKPKPIGLF